MQASGNANGMEDRGYRAQSDSAADGDRVTDGTAVFRQGLRVTLTTTLASHCISIRATGRGPPTHYFQGHFVCFAFGFLTLQAPALHASVVL